jgi:hypothetical protein
LNLLVKTVSLHQARPILIPSPYRNLFKRKETDFSSPNLTNVFAIFMTAEIRASDRAVGLAESLDTHERQSFQLAQRDVTQLLLVPRCLHAFFGVAAG